MPVLSTVAAATARAYGLTANNPFAGTALRLDFDQTTTLDSRITFTRATNGTYFDSAGTLQTASSGVARFDHRLEGGVWVNKGLLIEEARTNLVLYSEEFNTLVSPPGNGWAQSQTVTTANQISAPDGNTTADAVKENSTTNFHFINTNNFLSLTAGTTFTISVFAKKFTVGSQRYLWLRANNNLFNGEFFALFNVNTGTITNTGSSGNGSYISSRVEDVGNDWYRCSVTGSISTGTTVGMYLGIATSTSSLNNYTGDNTSGFYFWGAQLEAGAFPTSYIKTTNASVTRNADVASMTSTNFSDWYNATEGTIFTQADMLGIGSGTLHIAYSISNNSAAERYLGVFQNAASLIGTFLVSDNSVDTGVVNSPDPRITAVPNQVYKRADAYKLDDFASTLDGRVPGTDTSGSLPTVDRLYLGVDDAGASFWLNGHIAKFYYWSTRKPNSFLQSITG